MCWIRWKLGRGFHGSARLNNSRRWWLGIAENMQQPLSGGLYSRRIALSLSSPLYSMKTNRRNLFIKRLTCVRVVPNHFSRSLL